MITQFSDLKPLLPELFLLGSAMLILLVDMFVSERRRGLIYFLSTLAVTLTAVVTWRAWAEPLPGVILNGMYVRDALGDVLKLFMYLTTVLVYIYAAHGLRASNKFRSEFFTLSLLALLGMMVMVSSSHLVTLYLGLELMALASYALVALDRDNPEATESAMKYFVLGAMASGLLLYGISLLYGLTGSLDLTVISAKLATMDTSAPILALTLIFIVIGIAFKFGAVPFHMWVPDVYQGSHTPVTLFIATVPKLAAIGMAFRLLPMGLGPLQEHWQDMLALLAAASLVLGNLAAIAQRNLKRMLAYSTISHVGFIFMGLVSGLVTGYAAAMFYVIVYALTTTAAFGLILALAQGEQRFEEIRDFRGLNQRKPWFAMLMLLVIASLAGFPPLVGFFAKLLVLKAAMDGGYLWLAILGGVSAVIGAFYYLRVLKVMYFDEPETEAELKVLPEVGVVLSVNALALLGLGFAFNPLLERCLAVWQ